MSMRTRLTVLVSAAVAFAVIAASLIAWAMIRGWMVGEMDDSLLARVPDAGRIERMAGQLPEGAPAANRLFHVNGLIQRDQVAVQFVGPGGAVEHQLAPPAFSDQLSALPADGVSLPVPPAGDPRLDTVTIAGENYRVLSTRVGESATIMRLFQPLSSLEQTLTAIGWALAATAAAGVALAAGVGWVVAAAAVRPVHRLVDAAEGVTATGDLSRRVQLRRRKRARQGKDELDRLGESFNSMLSALETSRAQQRELLENASHELRTPLTVLRNDFGLLARLERADTSMEDERRQLIEDLDTQVAALADEVDQIVTLARGDAVKEPRRLTSLPEIVEQAAVRVRRLDPAVAVTVDAQPATAVIYPVALERAVTNLARNAVQACTGGGTVTLVLRTTASAHRIEVLDDGPGLDPDEIPRLFQRFFRGSHGRTKPGSGLGLAIVDQVAALHGGEARAMNRPGGGACFVLEWPSATHAARAAANVRGT
ncbi:HAMP domain-containing sensor histidine kinase [Nocardiopsis quinghaiensis]|uniref:HAMP domain-containing sensor histidine kinase n=1 Tax=Nocardiopsis quinghaiensis TaxID=464995 RepID=UPI00123912FA|nr:HAMP domain-containing sensor histidine kinase [Nocardiopsis quinghaiensis]